VSTATEGLASADARNQGQGAPTHPVVCRRLYLSPYDLTPTYKNVHNKFNVKYFLNLVLVDEEDRRYFKQQEIELFRLAEPALAPGELEDAEGGSMPARADPPPSL
jgi:Vacuolar protein sorting-associated protein 26